VPAKRDFTDRFLRAIRPAPSGKRTIAYDAQIPGFGVRVTDKGCRSFVLVARFGGANNPTARRIGSYLPCPSPRRGQSQENGSRTLIEASIPRSKRRQPGGNRSASGPILSAPCFRAMWMII
jgi:hypothetical protein